MTEKEKFDAYIKAVMNYCNEQDDPEVALNEIMNDINSKLIKDAAKLYKFDKNK